MVSSDSDVLLRLKLSCATAHSHYDQVVAVSQKIINDAFDSLYVDYPEWSTVKYSNRRIGSVDGTLNSPRLLLGGGLGAELSLTSALYVMRFKGGILTIPNEDEEEDDYKEDLAGWNLAVTIDLKSQGVVVDPNADPDEKEREQKLWDFIHNRFDIPGDYSVTRLYAKLADAHWRDFDYQNSQFGFNDDGTPRSWGQLIKKYPYLEDDLQIMLKRWAKDQEEHGLTTTGVKMTLPPPEEIDPLKASFLPTAMIHQVYPYKNPDKGVDKPVISYDTPGNLNSLLYCEMVDGNELPEDQQLASVGNFTTQASSLGGPRIDGTFTLSHQLFLGNFLLPMLESFNQASIVDPYESWFSYSGKDSAVYWKYAIGSDGYVGPDKNHYSFLPVYNPETPNDATAYRYSKTITDKISPNGYNPNSNDHASFTSEGTCQVDFKWNPGDSSFSLAGESVYKYDVEWADNSAIQRPWGWLRDAYRCTWNMKINIDSVEGGVLKMSVDAGANNDCSVSLVMTQHEQQQSTTPDGQTENIKSQFTNQILSYVQTLKENLSQIFQTTGKFTYPGNGTFNFSDPVVGNTGEILATVAYKPLVGNSKIKVPEPSIPVLKKMSSFPFQGLNVNILGITPVLKLDWSYRKPAKGASKNVEILINGKNNSGQAISLVGVDLTLSSEPSGRGLVTSKDFKSDNWTIGNPNEKTKSNVFQIVDDSDGTAVFTSITVVDGKKTPEGITPITFSGTGDALIAPGSTITLALLTGTGVPDTYSVSITETWPKVESMASQSVPKNIKVILSP